jgi:hypothetical protein
MKKVLAGAVVALALSLASHASAQNNSLININIQPSAPAEEPQNAQPQDSPSPGGGALNIFLGDSDADRRHRENERIALEMYQINMQNLAIMERQAKTQEELARVREERRLASERLKWDRAHHDLHPGQNYPEHLRSRYQAQIDTPPKHQPASQPRQPEAQHQQPATQQRQQPASQQRQPEPQHQQAPQQAQETPVQPQRKQWTPQTGQSGQTNAANQNETEGEHQYRHQN